MMISGLVSVKVSQKDARFALRLWKFTTRMRRMVAGACCGCLLLLIGDEVCCGDPIELTDEKLWEGESGLGEPSERIL